MIQYGYMKNSERLPPEYNIRELTEEEQSELRASILSVTRGA